MRIALILALLLIAAPSYAERYAIVGLDDIVVTVIEYDGYPTDAVTPSGGYIVLAPQGSGAESGGSYKNGVFSPRPKGPQEILVERMNGAIDANRLFIAILAPTQEQTAEQVKRLTQQVTAILQYQLQRFEGVVQ
jgi:hypothetical protein